MLNFYATVLLILVTFNSWALDTLSTSRESSELKLINTQIEKAYKASSIDLELQTGPFIFKNRVIVLYEGRKIGCFQPQNAFKRSVKNINKLIQGLRTNLDESEYVIILGKKKAHPGCGGVPLVKNILSFNL